MSEENAEVTEVEAEVTTETDSETESTESKLITLEEADRLAKEKLLSFKDQFIKSFNDDKLQERVAEKTLELNQKLQEAESSLAEVSRKYEVASLSKKHGVREETLMASKLSGEDLETLAKEIAAERSLYSGNATSVLNAAVVKEEKEDWVAAVARQITGGN